MKRKSIILLVEDHLEDLYGQTPGIYKRLAEEKIMFKTIRLL